MLQPAKQDPITTFVQTGQLPAFCLARCCECFHISNKDLDFIYNDTENTNDGPYIKNMLIPVEPEKATQLHRSWGFVNWRPLANARYFTCKHWDRKTRLCKDYDNRPKMCRDYGSGQVCKHGCGLA